MDIATFLSLVTVLLNTVIAVLLIIITMLLHNVLSAVGTDGREGEVISVPANAEAPRSEKAELYRTKDGTYSYKVYNENKRRLQEKKRGIIDVEEEFGIPPEYREKR